LVWPVKDGYVMYMIYTGQFGAEESRRLTRWLDEEGFADDYLRGLDWATLDWRNRTREEGERIQDYFGRFFQSKTKSELLAGALARQVMIQPVSTPKDLMEHPQLQAREYYQELHHEDLGTSLKYPGRVCLFSDAPAKPWRRAPFPGEHNLEVYQGELGYTAAQLTALKQAGVI
jgi:crotonobetainyl-CoA:carnitine CoA-transferase CaiB-like acyl-CoA transferase